jgi:hypothetical protein
MPTLARILAPSFLFLPLAAAAALPYDAETLATARRLRDQALQQNQAWATLESIATEVGPRPAGSEGDRKAVEWALARLRTLGFENVHAETVTVPHWVRGQTRVAYTDGGAVLTAVALGGSVATPAGGVTAPVVRVDSIEALKALGADAVQGKIVFLDVRLQRTRDGSGYGIARPLRSDGPSLAGQLGAAAILIRSIGTSTGAVAHTGMMRYADGVPRIASLAISNDDADALAARLAQGAVLLSVFADPHYEPDAQSANVIGEIPGASDEIVLLGAHLDSWDLAQGANDDGAGVAIVSEAARMVREVAGKPRRTLRVVLFANEEFGLSGARQYAIDHRAEIGKHVAAMEADFGAGAVWQMGGRVADSDWTSVQQLVSLLKPLGVVEGRKDAFGGSDIAPLAQAGVPVLAPGQDGTRYFDTHHSQADTLANIDRPGLSQNVAVYAVAAYLAAQRQPAFRPLPPQQGGDE